MTATVGDAVAPDACLSDTAARHVIDEAAARQRKTSRLSEFLINSELCSFRFDFRAGSVGNPQFIQSFGGFSSETQK